MRSKNFDEMSDMWKTDDVVKEGVDKVFVDRKRRGDSGKMKMSNNADKMKSKDNDKMKNDDNVFVCEIFCRKSSDYHPALLG